MINGKQLKPAWSPPAEVKRDKPSLPNVIPGGSPSNPMGAAAMTLSGGEYAIHGTNQPSSIGGFVSYGCIRMYNADVLDLYSRVELGNDGGRYSLISPATSAADDGRRQRSVFRRRSPGFLMRT